MDRRVAKRCELVGWMVAWLPVSKACAGQEKGDKKRGTAPKAGAAKAKVASGPSSNSSALVPVGGLDSSDALVVAEPKLKKARMVLICSHCDERSDKDCD